MSTALIHKKVYKYRVSQQVSDLGWVDFDLDVPLMLHRCSAHSAYLSSAKQNQASSGTAKIKVNPTQLETCWYTLYNVHGLFFSSGCDTSRAFASQRASAFLHPGQEPVRLLRAQDFVQIGRRASPHSRLRTTFGES